MYQCSSFYSSNMFSLQDSNNVIAAWDVKADQSYSYAMENDIFTFENMICFIRTIEGTGKIKTKSGTLTLSENEYIFLTRKNIEHYCAASKIWNYYWVDFIHSDINIFQLNTKAYIKFSKNEQNLFENLLDVGKKFSNEANYINTVFSHYLYYLKFENSNDTDKKKEKTKFSEICQFINQKIYSPLSVKDIANFFEITPRRVNQIFFNEKQMSPKKYISNLKIEKSKQILLQTTESIKNISELLCYNNPYHFSASFKKSEGISPSEFRSINKQ